MLESYVGIEKTSSFTLIEKKSKFYAFAIPVVKKSEIDDHLKDFRIKYSDATHICYAYVINDGGVQEKFSDDGEPSGTAGYPICAVIKKRNLTNVLIVVVRYFGKIKLGAGGLIRAYSSCASGVLDECVEHKYYLVKKLSFSFDSYDYFRYTSLFSQPEIKQKKENFVSNICNVELCVTVNNENIIIEKIKSINSKIDILSMEFYL